MEPATRETVSVGTSLIGASRQAFTNCACEILPMKHKIGIEDVGLGTDDGGKLPALIDGYRQVRDLGRVATAMLAVGLSREDVSAYMGGNFLRVFRGVWGRLTPFCRMRLGSRCSSAAFASCPILWDSAAL